MMKNFGTYKQLWMVNFGGRLYKVRLWRRQHKTLSIYHVSDKNI